MPMKGKYGASSRWGMTKLIAIDSIIFVGD